MASFRGLSRPAVPSTDTHWKRFLLAIVLLVWADLASTVLALRAYGPSGEANPIMRWLLYQDLVFILAVHVLIFVCAILAFLIITRIGESLEGTRSDVYWLGCYLWTTALIIIGAVIVINNLTLVVLTTVT